ncbi:alpha-mannosidase 2C1-like [Ptychodera flava]|uniref:alpha-mannosidase 2C1-like n=1 Tax=Ptychodera flava TaxID=63121 RepID=UPI003969FC7C
MDVVVAKNKRATLERAEKFISPHYFTDVNLHGRVYPEKIPLTNLKHFATADRIQYQEACRRSFSDAKIGEKFGPLWSTHWFKLEISIPANWVGKEVRLVWDSGSEAMVWQNGEPVQGLSGDCQHRKDFILSQNLTKDELRQTLYIEMACNEMFGGGNGLINPPDENKEFQLSTAEIAVFDRDVYNLITDFELLIGMAKHLSDEDQRTYQALYTANKMVNVCKIDNPKSYKEAHQIALSFFAERNGDSQHTVHAMGHCHIDSAWLWTYDETKRKCARSWSATIRLMDMYPSYTFVCSQAQQYEWVKINYPGLYERMKEKIKASRFIPVGGCWVEMDGNVPSGESFVRQFLVGQKFFQKEFGIKCKEFWLPDTFGYSAQLPQIMNSAGIKRFVTQKLSWNLVNKFPHNTFTWEGIDGSKTLAHFPPGDNYGLQCRIEDLLKTLKNNKDKGRVNSGMMLYGYGDGGGGPTEDMLERLERLQNVDGLPKVTYSTPDKFFEDVEKNSHDLCKWTGELYLELHQGTFTSQAKIKWYNRKLEFLLHNLEFISTAAWVKNTSYRYPQQELSQMWKNFLLNQFHDVLPGSCIDLVAKDAIRFYEEIEVKAEAELKKACMALSAVTDKTSTQPSLMVINTHSWERVEVVALPSSDERETPAKKKQKLSSSLAEVTENVQYAAVKASPYGISHLIEIDVESVKIQQDTSGLIYLQNKHITAQIDQCGRLCSLLHHAADREAIAPSSYGNQFVIFDDVPLFWDAWDVMDYHLETRTAISTVRKPAQIIEKNKLRCAVKVSLQISTDSYIEQVISLDATSTYLKMDTKVHWKENRKFLKVEFPVTVRSMQATYEIQFGHVQRPTHGNTSWDSAKYEVVGHKWADLSEHNWGVAVLNDSKYGHCTQGNVIRLSLLKAAKAPDANADMGYHDFTYAVFPHTGTLQDAGVIQASYDMNNPLQLLPSDGALTQASASLFQVDNVAVILETVKKAEDIDNAIVLRLYEAYGSTVTAKVSSQLPIKTVRRCNILEEELDGNEVKWNNGSVSLSFSPFQIVSLLAFI